MSEAFVAVVGTIAGVFVSQLFSERSQRRQLTHDEAVRQGDRLHELHRHLLADRLAAYGELTLAVLTYRRTHDRVAQQWSKRQLEGSRNPIDVEGFDAAQAAWLEAEADARAAVEELQRSVALLSVIASPPVRTEAGALTEKLSELARAQFHLGKWEGGMLTTGPDEWQSKVAAEKSVEEQQTRLDAAIAEELGLSR